MAQILFFSGENYQCFFFSLATASSFFSFGSPPNERHCWGKLRHTALLDRTTVAWTRQPEPVLVGNWTKLDAAARWSSQFSGHNRQYRERDNGADVTKDAE